MGGRCVLCRESGPVGCQLTNVRTENAHTKNTSWSEQVMVMNTYAYRNTCMYSITSHENRGGIYGRVWRERRQGSRVVITLKSQKWNKKNGIWGHGVGRSRKGHLGGEYGQRTWCPQMKMALWTTRLYNKCICLEKRKIK